MSCCRFCSGEFSFGQLFCVCCGAALVEPADSQHLFRIRLFRHLLRSRVWITRQGLRSVTRQLTLLSEMQQQNPLESEQQELKFRFLVDDLLSLENELYFAPLTDLLIAVGPLVSMLSRTNLATRFEEFSSNVENFIKGLRKTSTQLQEGNVNQRKLRKWFDQHASQHGFDDLFAQDLIYATPHYWSHLAAYLEPNLYEQAASLISLNQGWSEFQQKNYGLARDHFQTAYRQDSTCTEALLGLAMIATKSGKYEEAIKTSRQAIEIGTTDPHIFNNFAWYVSTETPFTDSRNQDLALAAGRRAVELAPLASFWDTLANVLRKLGLLPDAVAAVREALREDPEKEVLRQRMEEIVADIKKMQQINLKTQDLPSKSDEIELTGDGGDFDLEESFAEFDECEDFAGAATIADEDNLDVADDVVGEDDVLDELDAFDGGADDFDDDFDAGTSKPEFVADRKRQCRRYGFSPPTFGIFRLSA